MWDEITYLFPNFKVESRWWNGRSERAIQYFLTHSHIRPEQNGRQFADSFLKIIFLFETILNYFPVGSIDNIPPSGGWATVWRPVTTPMLKLPEAYKRTWCRESLKWLPDYCTMGTLWGMYFRIYFGIGQVSTSNNILWDVITNPSADTCFSHTMTHTLIPE